MPDPTALATLIFAAMAGIGSLVRVYQNQRYCKWVQRNHRSMLIL
jgi:hypothetical protein